RWPYIISGPAGHTISGRYVVARREPSSPIQDRRHMAGPKRGHFAGGNERAWRLGRRRCDIAERRDEQDQIHQKESRQSLTHPSHISPLKRCLLRTQSIVTSFPTHLLVATLAAFMLVKSFRHIKELNFGDFQNCC